MADHITAGGNFLSGRYYFYKHKPASADEHGKDLSQQAFNIGTTKL